MNYQRIYNSIIENRKSVPFNGYTETHHIVPKSLGGADDKSNLVELSAREHFMCHLLLTKIYNSDTVSGKKMVKAFMLMLWYKNDNQERYVTSREYTTLKEKFSAIQKESQSGNGNSQYGTMWIHNKILKKNIKIKKTDIIPDGWLIGRIVNWESKEKILTKQNKPKKEKILTKQNKPKKEKILTKQNKPKKEKILTKQIKPKQEKEKILNEKVSFYENYYEIYKNVGFDKFVNVTGYDKSKANLVQQFAKYVKSFVPQNGKKR